MGECREKVVVGVCPTWREHVASESHQDQGLHFTRENTLSTVPSHLPEERASRALRSIKGSGNCVWVQNGAGGVSGDESRGEPGAVRNEQKVEI